MSAPPAIVFDTTHLVTRLRSPTPNGMARLDFAYADYLSNASGGAVSGLHLGILGPHLWRVERLRKLTRMIADRWRERTDASTDPAFIAVRDWLAGHRTRAGDARLPDPPGNGRSGAMTGYMAHLHGRVERDYGVRVPDNAIYLSIAQHGLHMPFFFRWLRRRPDVKPVFMIHDLLPLDYPEFFVPGYDRPFDGIVATAARLARAFIVTTNDVGSRLELELRRRGYPCPPIHVAAPPSPDAFDRSGRPDEGLRKTPYFVVSGTIEPRKNHLLLLNEWRTLAAAAGGSGPPKLVIVGARGWENEQTLAMLENCGALRDHVLEVRALSTPGLRQLVANARALLMPSFAEGYGLPIGEALALGTPVVASDIPVFREVTQGRATFRHPLDGPGWRAAILELVDAGAPAWIAAKAEALRFEAPRTDDYFDGVARFLARV